MKGVRSRALALLVVLLVVGSPIALAAGGIAGAPAPANQSRSDGSAPTAAAASAADEGPTDGPEAIRRDVTGDGTEDIRIENGEVFLELHGENVSGPPRVADRAGRTGEGTVLDPLGTTPKNPYSSTQSDSPTYESTVAFEVVADTDRVASYRVVRNYSYEHTGAHVRIAWQATLFEGSRYAVVNLTITNVGSEPVELDQDEGDIHEGIQLYNSLKLAGRSGNDGDYRFHLGDGPTRRFADQGQWRTFSGTETGTLFDDGAAATVGLLDGTTGPEQWITEGHSGDRIGYHVGETTVRPGRAAAWTTAVAIHCGGSDAPRAGRELVDEAADRTDEIPPPEGVNIPPVAAFTASPAEPTAGEPVLFDARNSTDPDGSIARYEWDFHGAGEPAPSPAVLGVTARKYPVSGRYDVTLRVTDDDGATNATTRTLTVAPEPIDGVTFELRPSEPVTGPDGAVTLDVVVDGIDAGVGSYELAVNVTDTSTATIEGATNRIGGTGDVQVATDGSGVRASAFAGDTNETGPVTVATVTLAGVAPGTTDLSVRATSISNESGYQYAIASATGATLTVRAAPDVGGNGAPARDPDGDGRYEDVNGDGDVTPGDATVLFNAVFRDDPAVTDNVALFDFNGDGTLAPGDATVLLEEAF